MGWALGEQVGIGRLVTAGLVGGDRRVEVHLESQLAGHVFRVGQTGTDGASPAPG